MEKHPSRPSIIAYRYKLVSKLISQVETTVKAKLHLKWPNGSTTKDQLMLDVSIGCLQTRWVLPSYCIWPFQILP